MEADIVVIGGGPGGYVAAIRAAQLGFKTVLVEENHLGGICLNWGCIPTKALLKVSELYHQIQHADEMGIQVKGVSVDIGKIIQRSRDVATKLASGIGHLMKKHNIQVIEGRGQLNGPGVVKVTNKDKKIADIKSKHIILATGARARVLPNMEPDGKYIVTYKEAMVPTSLPKSLAIVGSGAIGIEFASFYNTLGVDVTVLEAAEQILPVEDTEISVLARRQFEAQGMKILTGVKVSSVKAQGQKAIVAFSAEGKDKVLEVERVIMAIGIVANTENLGLTGTRVQLQKGHIVTDGHGRTEEPGVYAIGDVTGGPWLAHKASHEAVVCVETIAGLKTHPLQVNNIPGCTYCYPQIASVGLTESKAKAAGYTLKVGKFPYAANGKAIAIGETDGLVKTIFDAKTGELLGAHIIGAEATEMINGYLIGKTMEATEADFMHTIFPHPTLSEMMHESVLQAYEKALHI